MTTLTFDVADFRTQFPAFANETTYPDPTLQAYWDAATTYISAEDYGWLNGTARLRALNLMTAHLTDLSTKAAAGHHAGIVQASTIDNVSVTLVPVPAESEWSYWMQMTPYGMQLLALLKVRAVGGMYLGGNPETAALRKTRGLF